MKKTKKDRRDQGKKQLQVTKEKVRDLRPLQDDELTKVGGGGGCDSITHVPPP